MAKEKPDTTIQSEAAEIKKASKRKTTPAKPDVKAQTQEAKDLRSLVNMLGAKNAPETSKDITAYAKETFKLVAKSQKAESAAFRREATKALIDFRNFVEQTTKLTETRRSQLLSQIDNVSLDAKNATMMMLTVAKHQAKNIRLAAHKEAIAEKLKAKEVEKNLMSEAKLKIKTLEIESRLRTKALSAEQEEKFKAIAQERASRYKMLMESAKAKIAEDKLELKERKEKNQLDIAKKKQDLKDEKEQAKQRYTQLRQQLRDAHEQRAKKLAQDKQEHQQKITQERLDLHQHRVDTATKIKKLKSDLRDDYHTKMRRSRADILQKRAELLTRNKERIDKIRLMKVEHQKKLKKIEEEAKAETLIRKAMINKQIKEINQNEVDRARTNQARRDEFNGKFKSGLMEANPLLHAAVEIGMGIGANKLFEKIAKKRDQKKLNKLQHEQKATPKPSATPSPGSGSGSASSGSGSGGKAGSGGGFFDGIGNLISGITNFFGGIGGAFSKLMPILSAGVRFLPVIGAVAATIGGVWKFIEGFNDASKLFGEKVADGDYVRKVYSGFTNVVGSVLGLFDTVAGWVGFDTDLENGFKKKAVNLFNAILDVFKSAAAGLGKLLDFIPGMGDVAKSLKDYGQSGKETGQIKPNGSNTAGILTDKTKTVNALRDDLEARKAKSASVVVAADNSVRQSSTTIVQPKLSTRNNESSVQLYGYGQPQPF